MNSSLPKPSTDFNANFEWIIQNMDKLVQSYPNCWIAVDGGQVLSAGEDLGSVQQAVAGRADPSAIVYHFIDDGSHVFHLP